MAVLAQHEHGGGQPGEPGGALGGGRGEFFEGAGGLDVDDGLGQQGEPADEGLGVVAHPGAAHGRADDRLDLLRLGGDRQIGLAARVQAPAAVAGGDGRGGEVDDGQGGRRGLCLEPAAEFEAAHVGEADVDEGHVGQGARAQPQVEFGERLTGGGDGDHTVPGPAQDRAHRVPAGGRVVDHQHRAVCSVGHRAHEALVVAEARVVRAVLSPPAPSTLAF